MLAWFQGLGLLFGLMIDYRPKVEKQRRWLLSTI
jgi:hypothetical protein